MISIDKPNRAPAILREPNKKGPKATKALKEAYASGLRDFEFNSKIYGAKSVKNRLIRAQFDKCCFCESKITHVSYGDVEHFRPKGGWVQDPAGEIKKPGYYWLAYDWTNLFLSCQICNQRFKRNHFPLLNPTRRSRSHANDIAEEKPVFLHPSQDDPERFIGFREEVAFPIDDSERARQTIVSLGLNRPVLEERRREYLKNVDLLLRTLRGYLSKRANGNPLSEKDHKLMTDIHGHLKELRQKKSPYSSMVKYATADLPASLD